MSLIRYYSPELSRWNPFERLSSLRDEVNRLFEGASSTSAPDTGLFTEWAPALDVLQDRDNVYVKVELPGLKKDEIDISVQEGILSVSGERKQESEATEGGSFRSERFFGRFHRSVALPASVDNARVTASYKDGILAVTLPKAEEAKPKQIEVTVS
jgi:HSP20 family protein